MSEKGRLGLYPFDKDSAVSYRRLRQAIGMIGLLMPIVVRVGGRLEGIASIGSISAYYYTAMRDVFSGTLILVGVLLACNRTGSRFSSLLSMLCGLAACGIALFPMDPAYAPNIVEKYPDIFKNDTTGQKGYFCGITFLCQYSSPSRSI